MEITCIFMTYRNKSVNVCLIIFILIITSVTVVKEFFNSNSSHSDLTNLIYRK